MNNPATFGFTLEGTEEMTVKLHTFIKKKRNEVRLALDSVLAEMVNWIKTNHEGLGGWISRNYALENSLSHQVIDDGNSIVGVVFANTDYAVWVEYKEGHWVISGAFTEFRDKLLKLILERVKAQG